MLVIFIIKNDVTLSSYAFTDLFSDFGYFVITIGAFKA